MVSSQAKMVQVNGRDWYVETRTGFDGPFKSESEAVKYLDLLHSSELARNQFAGLQFSPHK